MFVFWVDPENGQAIALPCTIEINNSGKEGRKQEESE